VCPGESQCAWYSLIPCSVTYCGSHKRGTIPDVGSKRINNGKVSTDLSEISGSHDVCPDDGGGMHL
jgi:hypothetical protein